MALANEESKRSYERCSNSRKWFSRLTAYNTGEAIEHIDAEAIFNSPRSRYSFPLLCTLDHSKERIVLPSQSLFLVVLSLSPLPSGSGSVQLK